MVEILALPDSDTDKKTAAEKKAEAAEKAAADGSQGEKDPEIQYIRYGRGPGEIEEVEAEETAGSRKSPYRYRRRYDFRS